MEIKDFCSFCGFDDEKTIYETENFKVVSAVGQITEGYSLIMPKDHYHCIGALPENYQKEYIALKNKIRSALGKIYGACIFYEHGRVGYCNVQPGEQLCYHGHTHAVPLNVNLYESLVSDGLVPVKLSDPGEIFNKYSTLGHYLYFEDNDSNAYMFQITHPIPRQYLRKLTANAIGKPELADWSKYPEREKMLRTVKKIQEVL